jgi:hypothetical protein
MRFSCANYIFFKFYRQIDLGIYYNYVAVYKMTGKMAERRKKNTQVLLDSKAVI